MAGKPIVNIKNASPASNTAATNVLANLPPGNLLQIQEYISIAPDLVEPQLQQLGLDQSDELQLELPTKSNDASIPSEDRM